MADYNDLMALEKKGKPTPHVSATQQDAPTQSTPPLSSPTPRETASMPSDEATNTRGDEYTTRRGDEVTNTSSDEATNRRIHEATSRRTIKRQSMDFYEDQLKTLNAHRLQEELAGRRISTSQMMREAIDEYIEKNTLKK